jgi:hypothetical protein
MQRKKTDNNKATQPPQPLYKGVVKAKPNTEMYVSMDKYIKVLEEKHALHDELKSLLNKEDCNQKKAFFFDIMDYQPFNESKTVALN